MVPINGIHEVAQQTVGDMITQSMKKYPELTERDHPNASCDWRTWGVTDENLQPRARMQVLMAYSNYFNALLLTTGNKSETAVGYCTLYGDMAGGLAVINDVPKTLVFQLARYINDTSRAEIIPWNSINKPPSAELRPDQKDQDSLPPYDILDEIMEKFVDEEKSVDTIIGEMVTVERELEYAKLKTGKTLREAIIWVCKAILRNEYKRKQSPKGLKITRKHFGEGWQMPIVHGAKL
jgi:NAD+ synthase (glutamine-hydrolysing)